MKIRQSLQDLSLIHIYLGAEETPVIVRIKRNKQLSRLGFQEDVWNHAGVLKTLVDGFPDFHQRTGQQEWNVCQLF